MLTLCKLLLTFTLIVFLNSFNLSQALPELEKVKEIKLLEHTRDDVRRILAEYKLQNVNYRYSMPPTHMDSFLTNSAEIEVYYSEGKCEFQGKTSYDWNISEWKVIEIKIIPKTELKLNEIGLNLSKFRKELQYSNQKNFLLHHYKELGIIIESLNNVVRVINFEPQKKYYLMRCDKKLAIRLLSTSSYYDPNEKKPYIIIDTNFPANVVNLTLDKIEIALNCDEITNRNCLDKVKTITVLTDAEDRDNDNMVYMYQVSGGKIIGIGAKVLWDLSDVKPGTYTITAAVDDGCGFCGKTMTKTVRVKECLDCKK